ncbi:type II secretion system secretin GspD [Endozoicomonas sp.]|uniref:type II secretion system secretin GspD n=1 Tax=Endozoicomonas sp. TaxID=1892382 RepID=UPI002888F3EE|nr:type II secretion system secretin GspD [Endozoicomonas sp.]
MRTFPLLLLVTATALFANGAKTGIQPATVPADNTVQIPDDKLWTLNQQNADIREFIVQVAKITGETFVIDPRIKSGNTVTVISTKPLTRDEVYDVFLEVLSANGYTVIPKADGRIINVVPTTTAKTSSPGKSKKPIGGIMTTKVIELHSVSAIEVIPIIRPLIAQYGHAAASASSNAVIVSDLADNVERIKKLIRELDDTGNNDYEVIQLRHAWVGDVSKIISDTLVTGKGQLPSGLQVIADERSNRLVIKGNASKRARVRKLADTLDKEGIRKSTTKVMFLSFADAKNIAEILSEASGIIQDSQGKTASTGSSPTASGSSPTSISSQSSQARGASTTKSGAKSRSAATSAFVKADETQNALVMIADPETLQEMEKIVRQLDVPRAQVLLEAIIVEVSGGINDALGIQWGINGTNTVQGDSTPLSKVTGNIWKNSKITLGSLALRADNFGVLVGALSSNSNNNILSTPSMLTLDNEEAELIIGKNIPIKTGSYQTSSSGNSDNPFTTTERKDVGLKLKITPHINEGNSLRLTLEQEVSSLDVGTTKDVFGDSGDLLFNTRSLKTAVLIDDGQTVVIGGLIEDIKSKTRKKVPLLGDIPLLGNLFRYNQTTNEKKNLMLFIRPTIMRNSETLVKATQDRYTKLKMIGRGGNSKPLSLPEKPEGLFETETYDMRNSDKGTWNR